LSIPIYKPQLPPYESVEPEIKEMYSSGMLYPGKYTQRLEDQVSDYMGVTYTHAVSSCSLGLILLLNLIPRRSKVIIPAFTFNATLQAAEWNDHSVIVVDVDNDGQMCPKLVRDALETYPDIAAVMPVHMWGNACYPDEYEKLCKEFGAKLFFDGAHVFGTTYLDRHISTFGDATCHSIAATKQISSGEGGLVITNDKNVSEGIQEGAGHGLVGSLDTRTRGLNGKIQEFNSILAYHAIKGFEGTKRRRTVLMNKYRKGLADLPLRIWQVRDNVVPSYKDCVVFTETPAERNRLETFLNERGVGTKRYFDPAVPDMGSFDGVIHSAYNSRLLASTCLTLPLYPALRDSEIDFIISTVNAFFGNRS
jgi:dTDP-4-amino-4,6-dideoxygalactose transaminase